MKSGPANNVDDYLRVLPSDARAALAKLRKTIKAAAPNATEIISYQIPTYKYNGPAAFKDHLSFFVMSPRFVRAHAAELKAYNVRGATIQFMADEPPPDSFVKKLVKARIAENEKRLKK